MIKHLFSLVETIQSQSRKIFGEALKVFRSITSLQHPISEDFSSVETIVERRQKQFKSKVENYFDKLIKFLEALAHINIEYSKFFSSVKQFY